MLALLYAAGIVWLLFSAYAILYHQAVLKNHTLKLVKNATAHVLTRTSIRDHASPIAVSWHWLPAKSRIEFKDLLHTKKAVNGLALSYLKELIVL